MAKISIETKGLKSIQENIRAQRYSFNSYEDAAQALIESLYLSPDGCDRTRSKGHAGIPLASAGFMSRLLKQLDMDLNWIDNNDTELFKHALGRMTGTFYVKDAKLEKN